MPVDGGSPGAAVRDSGNQRYPGWSPDGRHLVFHSDRTGRFELYVVERDTGGRWGAARQLTTQGGQDARWSPDGGSILYLRDGNVWTIPMGGGAPQLVLSADSADSRPLLARGRAPGDDLYTARMSTAPRGPGWSPPRRPRELVRFDDLIHTSSRAEFATDGKRLFTASERESDIWRMSASDERSRFRNRVRPERVSI